MIMILIRSYMINIRYVLNECSIMISWIVYLLIFIPFVCCDFGGFRH